MRWVPPPLGQEWAIEISNGLSKNAATLVTEGEKWQ
jgi:hypothetical protein